MNPYETLGVEPGEPIEEIETSYRLMLRRFNPKGMPGVDPATKADAAIRTREIHAAMAQVRKDHRGGGPRTWGLEDEPPGAADDLPYAPGSSAVPAAAEPEWTFDDLLERVPCPYCGEGFLELDAFRRHLRDVHHKRVREKKQRKVRDEPTVFQILGPTRCAVAGILIVIAIACLLARLTIWIPIGLLTIVVLGLLTAAMPKGNRGSHGSRRVKQHKTGKFF